MKPNSDYQQAREQLIQEIEIISSRMKNCQENLSRIIEVAQNTNRSTTEEMLDITMAIQQISQISDFNRILMKYGDYRAAQAKNKS